MKHGLIWRRSDSTAHDYVYRHMKHHLITYVVLHAVFPNQKHYKIIKLAAEYIQFDFQ